MKVEFPEMMSEVIASQLPKVLAGMVKPLLFHSKWRFRKTEWGWPIVSYLRRYFWLFDSLEWQCRTLCFIRFFFFFFSLNYLQCLVLAVNPMAYVTFVWSVVCDWCNIIMPKSALFWLHFCYCEIRDEKAPLAVLQIMWITLWVWQSAIFGWVGLNRLGEGYATGQNCKYFTVFPH